MDKITRRFMQVVRREFGTLQLRPGVLFAQLPLATELLRDRRAIKNFHLSDRE
jgi:hypothetical protein